MTTIIFHQCIHCHRPKPPNGEPYCTRCKTAGIRNRHSGLIKDNRVTRYRVIRQEKQS